MKSHKRKHRVPMLAVVLALGALLVACGTDAPTGNTVQTAGGVVTTGTPTAGLNICVSCHAAITTNWMLTKHANVEPIGNLYSAGNPTLGQIAGCTKNCHDSTGDGAGNQFAYGVTGNVARPVVGCESCHSGGQMHAQQGGAGPIGFATETATVIGTTSSLPVSAQFTTCTGCHELLDPADPANVPAVSTHGTVTPTGSGYIITDTHFATAGYFGASGTSANTNTITGYAMDFASEKVCSDCHNPHMTADVNRDWAQSPHAEVAAAAAWAHYNWSLSTRRSCERCHTTTGYSNYAAALQAGDMSRAEQLRLGNVTLITETLGWKPEMLKCNGCHSDNRGALRKPGPYLATYSLTAAQNTYHQFPNVGSSNVCILCHSGRSNGDNIKTMSADFANLKLPGQFNGHHATSAATMFRALGYTYDGRDYSDPASYKHNQIGTPAAPNTGSGGPCMGCHMFRSGQPASHLFSAVGRSGDAVISISSEVCFNCHAGSSSALAAVVEDERLAFTYALGIFNSQLTTTNAVHGDLISNATTTSSWLSPGDTDLSGNTTAKNSLGALFNYNSLYGNEMAAFIHNSKYAKRLLYDSIDWLDDNLLNYSVGTTLDTLCSSATTTCATGMNYLLPNGVRPGASSERPY
ncbi:MAG: hypothetical protein ACYC7L_17515 [Nitrospirota bacterium]